MEYAWINRRCRYYRLTFPAVFTTTVVVSTFMLRLLFRTIEVCFAFKLWNLRGFYFAHVQLRCGIFCSNGKLWPKSFVSEKLFVPIKNNECVTYDFHVQNARIFTSVRVPYRLRFSWRWVRMKRRYLPRLWWYTPY